MPENHPFLDYSEEELIDVLIKADEWSIVEVVIAELLLKKKGVESDKIKIEEIKEQRCSSLKVPEKGKLLFYILAFIAPLFASLSLIYLFKIVFFLAGISVGVEYHCAKKKLNKKSYYKYTTSTKKVGLYILIVNAIFIVYWIASEELFPSLRLTFFDLLDYLF